MSDHSINWSGGYTNITAASLLTLNTALKNTYGLVQVGQPVFDTFGTDGISASARYRQGSVSLFAEGGVVRITARIRKDTGDPNWAGVKALFKNTLGLVNHPDGKVLGIVEQVLEA
jgi:hypothetical protein